MYKITIVLPYDDTENKTAVWANMETGSDF
jgi:hypothetical protein